MAGLPPPLRRRGTPAVAWILLLAVLVGVAAALLSRPVGAFAPPSSRFLGLTWTQFSQLVTVLGVVLVGLWLVFLLRDAGNRAPIPSRVVATVLVILLLGVLFVEFAGLVHVAPIPSSSNTTGGSRPPPGGVGQNGTGTNNTTVFGTPGITLPAWAGFASVLVVALLAGVLLVPLLVRRAEARRSRLGEEGPAVQVHEALQEALHRLSSADPADARAAIVALYARLLLLVGPRIGTLESRTPGEIQRESIASLGLRPRVARDLTESFEEARYSSHPMSAEAVDRARAALREAISDLAQSAGVPA